jgi:hypothetical protein
MLRETWLGERDLSQSFDSFLSSQVVLFQTNGRKRSFSG